MTGDGKEDVNFVPKHHEERWIPLTTELVELLKERKKNPPDRRWVFVNKDGDAEGHFLRKFKAIAKRAGLNFIRDVYYHGTFNCVDSRCRRYF